MLHFPARWPLHRYFQREWITNWLFFLTTYHLSICPELWNAAIWKWFAAFSRRKPVYFHDDISILLLPTVDILIQNERYICHDTLGMPYPKCLGPEAYGILDFFFRFCNICINVWAILGRECCTHNIPLYFTYPLTHSLKVILCNILSHFHNLPLEVSWWCSKSFRSGPFLLLVGSNTYRRSTCK